MDIHKPKPVHSLREFLSEIAVVVCGIAIALTGEQVIEALHRNAEVREAREALQAEIKVDAGRLVYGIEEDKCLLPQLKAYAAWARGGSKPPPFRTYLSGFNASTWETVKSTAVPLMPIGDRLKVTQFYDNLANAQKVVDLQRSNALVLFGADERTKLSEVDAGRVLDAVSVEQHMTDFYQANAQSLLKTARGLGVNAPSIGPDERAVLDWECGRGPSDPGGKGGPPSGHPKPGAP
jgi:hypothetical protein